MLNKKERKEVMEQLKENHLIGKTGQDSKGLKYGTLGALNAAAWVGENAGILFDRIEELEKILSAAKSLLPLVEECRIFCPNSMDRDDHLKAELIVFLKNINKRI